MPAAEIRCTRRWRDVRTRERDLTQGELTGVTEVEVRTPTRSFTVDEPPTLGGGERYQQLAAAVDEHCPVLDLFRNPVPVDRTITIH